MPCQMILVISSPSISTTGRFTRILAMEALTFSSANLEWSSYSV